MQLVEGVEIQAIAFGEAVGDIRNDIGPHRAQAARQCDTGSDPVGVIVAIDGDPLPTRDRLRDQIAGDRHIFQEKRIGCLVEVGLQPRVKLSLPHHPTPMQNLTEHRREGLQSWLSSKWLGEDPVPAFLLQGRPHYGTALRQLRVGL